jgi:hypothetical protein
MHVGLHVKCPVSRLQTYFIKILQYHSSQKCIKRSSYYLWTDIKEPKVSFLQLSVAIFTQNESTSTTFEAIILSKT